jgi:hypothetical protein
MSASTAETKTAMAAKHRDDRTPLYAVPCECGGSLQASPAQAGALLVCPACQSSVPVPSLSALREQEPCAYTPDPERRPFQFSLAELMGVVTLWAVFLSCIKSVGLLEFATTLGKMTLAIFFVSLPLLVIIVSRLFWDLVGRSDTDDED